MSLDTKSLILMHPATLRGGGTAKPKVLGGLRALFAHGCCYLTEERLKGNRSSAPRKLTASFGHLKEAPGDIQTRRLVARLVGTRPAITRHPQAPMVRLWMAYGTPLPLRENRRQK